jgi:rubredoxin
VGKWKCSLCGYIYDSDIGIPSEEISTGTFFEQLPDDWVCPMCNLPKTAFEKE